MAGDADHRRDRAPRQLMPDDGGNNPDREGSGHCFSCPARDGNNSKCHFSRGVPHSHVFSHVTGCAMMPS